MTVSTDLIAIILSVFIVAGILLYNSSKNLGIPSFIIFMGIGLFLGDGTWGEPVYDNPELTEFLSSMALNIIIFVGGYNTSYPSIKCAYKEGLLLSTVGVLITALSLGYFTYWVTDLPLITAILFGSIVSSTDAAAVFGILETKRINLKHNTGTILEFESATNDPMALILVTIFTASALNGASDGAMGEYAFTFSKLLLIGAASGLLFGLLTQWVLTKIEFHELGLVPIFMLAMFFIATYSSNLMGGNLLVASYIFGVIAGNTEHAAKLNSTYFNHSLSWLAQALMFLFLGLQIFTDQLGPVFVTTILPALFLILAARPLAVMVCYLPFRSAPWSKRLFVSTIGLKGATPIVFAFVPLLQGVPRANELFNMVFFVVLFSIAIQGTLLGPAAKWLQLQEK
ncbi:potassium/proton antiporter [Methylicorpusculum oleiharenae]|uniref:potassium/proton antiporter n=1 Tax=Methylicorpusculum oleiharenae TaxID=1338687 RepID=UPI001358CCCA|nr:potassium/proton antiporter [Methylicorpusculum oleiharenae]MCD2452557.1 potassium/proton antiporter [Methylicorpusculum oleiharenae]